MAPGQNVEIKARLRNPDAVRQTLRELTGSDGEQLRQEDIFFPVPEGRLKLRILEHDYGELIFYRRADEARARLSTYAIAVTPEPGHLLDVLSLALGRRAAVRKTRRVYLVGQSRIHLDSVEGLGDFVEIEFVMQPGDEERHGQGAIEELMSILGIEPADLVESAYVDLLQARG